MGSKAKPIFVKIIGVCSFLGACAWTVFVCLIERYNDGMRGFRSSYVYPEDRLFHWIWPYILISASAYSLLIFLYAFSFFSFMKESTLKTRF